MRKILLPLFIYCSLMACKQPTAPGAFFHNGLQHTGVYSTTNYQAIGQPKWKFKTDGKIFSSPLINDGLIYIGSEDKKLYALDASTGNVKWAFATGGAVHSSAAVHDNEVYIESFDGAVYALDATTGALIWKFKTGGEKLNGRVNLWTMKPANEYMNDPFDFFLSSPAIQDSIVYVGSSDGNMYALSAATGQVKWRLQTGGLVHTSPALYNNTVYFGSWDTYMYAVDALTGQVKWKFKTGSDTAYHQLEGIQASALVYDSTVYFGARDGFFYALDAETGSMKWKYSANSSWILSTAAAKDGVIYTSTSDTYLFLALDAKTGKEVFKVKTNGYAYSSPAIAGSTAFLGDFSGQLLAVNLSNGQIESKFYTDGRKQFGSEVLKKDSIDFATAAQGADLSLYSSTVKGMANLYKLGPIVSSPCISGNMLYVGSADGYVYALELK